MTDNVNDSDKNTLTRRKLLAGAAAGFAVQTLTAKSAEAKASPTVLITGANRGIGLELARNYAQQDWQVYATARRPEAADDLKAIAAKHPKLRIEQLDVLDHEMIDSLAMKLDGQPIDVLLNNAAILG